MQRKLYTRIMIFHNSPFIFHNRFLFSIKNYMSKIFKNSLSIILIYYLSKCEDKIIG